MFLLINRRICGARARSSLNATVPVKRGVSAPLSRGSPDRSDLTPMEPHNDFRASRPADSDSVWTRERATSRIPAYQ